MKDKIRKIGVMGGTSIYELGPIKDVVLFFECLDYFVVNQYAEQDWSLLADRLYRRYLRIDELEQAGELMKKVKEIFSEITNDEVDWGHGIQGDSNKTWLDAQQPTLDIIFSKHFDCFDKAVDSAVFFNKEYGEYFPVRLSISNSIIFVLEGDRPLNQYDELTATDEPFWLLSVDDFNKTLGHCG